MHVEFEMRMMGELKFFIGIKINQSKSGTHVHQSKYTMELLKKFNLEDYKIMSTSMHPTCCLNKEESRTKIYQKLYIDPRKTHLTDVKRIFKYLKGIINLGFLYKKSLDNKLLRFCDADYAGDGIKRKSTSGNNQFIGKNLIYWTSNRQEILLYLQQKHNTSQLQNVVHIYSG
ncbi:uncharacterized mitochondrial protein AtMg00810-like [Lathyrus oleraceus]|uniref:uncharacterized mitochondrial protein AtMg00810-like n=1 Tax=Pisum sativum TaxID=3888 RepID=UPI0021D1B1D4|nr:uncharacterized mitochondrial protein AtMg00810-like [Pisum sativum]